MTAEYIEGRGWCRHYRVVETFGDGTVRTRRVLEDCIAKFRFESFAKFVSIIAPSGEKMSWRYPDKSKGEEGFQRIEDTRLKEPT